jgi:hypothetical protein
VSAVRIWWWIPRTVKRRNLGEFATRVEFARFVMFDKFTPGPARRKPDACLPAIYPRADQDRQSA